MKPPCAQCGHGWGEHAMPPHVDYDIDNGERWCFALTDEGECRCRNYVESAAHVQQLQEDLKAEALVADRWMIRAEAAERDKAHLQEEMDRLVAAALEQSARKTRPMAEKELEAERVTSEVLSLRLDAPKKGMDQQETFNWLVERSNRLEAAERALREIREDNEHALEDVRLILRALGEFDGARPISPHAVVATVVLPAIARLRAELERQANLLNTPELHDFSKAVVLEAAHQRERWPTGHDANKTDADWFWLIGYLAGKALHTPIAKDLHSDGPIRVTEKRLHRIITIAAAAANWHAQVALSSVTLEAQDTKT
jgi:hypothetical protein